METEWDYWETVKTTTRPFPESQAVLEQLASEYRLALITNTQGQVTSGSHRINLIYSYTPESTEKTTRTR